MYAAGRVVGVGEDTYPAMKGDAEAAVEGASTAMAMMTAEPFKPPGLTDAPWRKFSLVFKL